MKQAGQKNVFSIWNEEAPAWHPLAGEAAILRFGNERFGLLDPARLVGIDPGTYGRTDLFDGEAAGPQVTTLTANDPLADLNETPGFNDTIGNAQAIDRGVLTVGSNPNLYDASLPSVVIQGSVSSSTDKDFFSITLQAGELLLLDVDGTNGLDSHLRLFGGPGNPEIGDDDDYVISDPGSEAAVSQFGHNTDSLIHFRASTSGTYYFSIESFQDQPNPSSGAYRLNVSIGPPATAAQIAAEDILALQSGTQWNHNNLSFGFPTLASQYPSSFEEVSPASDFAPFTGTQINATVQLLQLVSNVASLTFTQNTATPGQADLRYAMSDDPEVTVAYAYYPTNGGPNSEGGSAWFNETSFNNPVKGNYAWMGILHESGHALGLKHGQEFPIALSADHDSVEFSVMTYRSYPGGPLTGYTNETWGYPQTLMMYDIAALQAIYGANFSTNSGDSVYTWSPFSGEMSINGVGQGAPGNGIAGSASRIFMTVWDGGGDDTYDMHNYGASMTIDLTPGGWSTMSSVQLADLGNGRTARGNVFNALQYNGDPRSLIENAIAGPSADVIIGNLAANRLEGGGGNDRIFGMDGNDVILGDAGNDQIDGGRGQDNMSGGAGDDVYVVDDIGDIVADISGFDTIYSSVFYSLSIDIERLGVNGFSTNYDINLTGNSLSNEIWGNDGRNVLDGGGGADIMRGFAGDDVYIVDNGSDVVVDTSGLDTIYTTIGYTLDSTIERLGVNGFTTTYAINLTGNGLDNELWGNDGVNVLNGGAGADIMRGQGGDDTYFVDNAGDIIVDSAGFDLVYTSVSYALGSNVERMGVNGFTTTYAINLTGNDLDNELWGNDGVNVIDGRGGADVLHGNGGADTFAFTTALGGGNVDQLVDFQINFDKIALDDAVFSGLTPGGLGTAAFRMGTSAQDADDRIIYDSVTGALYFDADGNGAGAAVQFASLHEGLALSASDFMVI